MSNTEPATYSAELQPERRRVPRIPFKTMSVVAERGSSRIVIAQTSDLSRFGCFVQAPEPYPQGTRVHVEMAEGGALTVKDAAKFLGVSTQSVYPRCERKQILNLRVMCRNIHFSKYAP